MYESILQEMARQHIRELHEEATAARFAKLIKERKQDRSKPPKAVQPQLKQAPARG